MTIMFSLTASILTIVTVGSIKIFELPVKAHYNLLFTLLFAVYFLKKSVL